MYVVRLEQTEGPDEKGNELDIYWLDVVLDEEQRRVDRAFLARRAGAMAPARVARGTIVAPWWHVRLDVGDGDVALLHWHGLLAELEDGVWRPLYPSLARSHVMGAPMVVRNFAFDLRTGAMRARGRAGDGRGAPTAQDKARLLAVIKQHMVFRGPEARANPRLGRRNPTQRIIAKLDIDRGTSVEAAYLHGSVGPGDLWSCVLLRDKISGILTFEVNHYESNRKIRDYRARGVVLATGDVSWNNDAQTEGALEAAGTVVDQLLLWLGEYPTGSYSVPWEVSS